MECYFVLKSVYKYQKEDVCEMLLKILKIGNIINDDKYILIEALNILKAHNIDFIDTVLCAKANIFGYEIKSFDKDIKKCLLINKS